MTTSPEDITRALLQDLNDTIEKHTQRLHQITLRLSRMERDLGNLFRGFGELRGDYAGLAVQLDEFDKRLARIERRLDLVETPAPSQT